MPDEAIAGLSALEAIRAAAGTTHATDTAGVVTGPRITVAAAANAPSRPQDIYDSKAHRWVPGYVLPGSYRLTLQLTRSKPSMAEPVTWRIVSDDRRFGPLDLTDNGIRVAGLRSNIARIPGCGPLTITARWKGSEYKTKVDLRDFLIVSIGDSFSSGQGNPDQNGVESVGSRALCETPTLIKLSQAIAAGIEDGIEKLEDIPALSTVVNGVEELSELARDLVDGALDLIGLGDAEDFLHMSTPPTWLEPQAWRSLRSAPSLAAQAAEVHGWGRLTTFVSVATSGATVQKGLLEPQRKFQRVGQIEEVARHLRNPRDRTRLARPVDVLVMSIGGNDCGFAGGLSDLTGENYIIGMLWRKAAQRQVREDTKAAIGNLADKYAELDEEIRRKLDPKEILILQYPAAMFDGPDGKPRKGCGIFDLTEDVGEVVRYQMHVSESDAAFIEEMGNLLNDEIAKAAKRHGWTLVDGIAADFKGHGYCAPDTFWVGASNSCHHQGDLEGTAHPNGKGTRKVADRLAASLHEALNRLTKNDPTAGVRPLPPDPNRPRRG